MALYSCFSDAPTIAFGNWTLDLFIPMGAGGECVFLCSADIYVFCCWIGEAISCSCFSCSISFPAVRKHSISCSSLTSSTHLSLLFLPDPPFIVCCFFWRSPCSHFTEKKKILLSPSLLALRLQRFVGFTIRLPLVFGPL
jgi:hypothetical protein